MQGCLVHKCQGCLGGQRSVHHWRGHFLLHERSPDLMELCQIAATQERRGSLFKDPFLGAVQSGLFTRADSGSTEGSQQRSR